MDPSPPRFYGLGMETSPSPRDGGIAIVVLTHNRVELLRKCVENVLLRTSGETREIVIWDNGSTDGTPSTSDRSTIRGYASCAARRTSVTTDTHARSARPPLPTWSSSTTTW